MWPDPIRNLLGRWRLRDISWSLVVDDVAHRLLFAPAHLVTGPLLGQAPSLTVNQHCPHSDGIQRTTPADFWLAEARLTLENWTVSLVINVDQDHLFRELFSLQDQTYNHLEVVSDPIELPEGFQIPKR